MKNSFTTCIRNGLLIAAATLSLTAYVPFIAQAESQAYDGGLQIDEVTLDYYLPKNVTYDPSVPKPAEILGFEVGQWHARHDQIVRYYEVLAEHSDRITLEYIGRSHEQRPLIIAKVSAAKNKDRLEDMRKAHLAVSDPSQNVNAKQAPLVVYAGFSIHGDESSGANASLLTAYYLAAAQGAEIDAWLDNTVIILEPAFNPDGLSRFAQWANQYRSMTQGADPNDQEYNQAWLRGRQNHYWFDLNRDWLLVQHPESRARIKVYQDWMPNVLTDHHEMGSHSTYFFQPGIPSRKNPDTPEENVYYTQKLAEFHAEALDEIHSLYYTEESFDDFYYGKGSSYPDAQGTIGILFEQASSRGHAQETNNGLITFPFTVKNQFVTSLSTIRGAYAQREGLLDFQQRFFKDNLKLAKAERHDGYLLRADSDTARLTELLEMLKMHRIDVYPITETFTHNGQTYEPTQAFYIPVAQRNFRLLKGAFSTRQDFPDNTFYDVSAWTLPYAFNVAFEEVRATRKFKIGTKPWAAPTDFTPNALAETQVGYVFSWEPYFAPRLLTQLQKAGVHTRLAPSPMKVTTPEGEVAYERGAIVVSRAYQTKPWAEVQRILKTKADANEIHVSTLASGLTSTVGMDIGSGQITAAKPPKVMILIGFGASVQEVGEAWYYLDRHVSLPVTKMEISRLAQTDLSSYTHIIMVDGHYNTITEPVKNKLIQWARQGGTLIGQKGGARWLAKNQILATQVVDQKEFQAKFPAEGLRFGDRSDYYAKQRVAGAIFNTQLDLTHPLLVGFSSTELPVFKDSTLAFHTNKAPFVDAASYPENPVLAGFTSQENREVLGQKTAILGHRYGAGRVIGFADNVNFRAYFWGTAKLLSNAIFWSDYVNGTPAPKRKDED